MGGADMKRSKWIVPGVLLLCWGMAVCAAAGPAAQSQSAERVKIQEARLPQIEALAAQNRERVEQWYKVRQNEVVQEITRREAARLSLAERGLWVQYADLYLDRFYAPAYFNAGFSSYRAAVLGNAMIQEYLISEMANLLASREFVQKLEQIVEERSEERLERRSEVPLLPLLRDHAEELLILVRRVQTELALQLAQLGNQRNARLDTIMEWEKHLKEQVRGILEYLRQNESRPVRFGAVASVGHGVNSGYYCMIEGVDKVLEVGDTVEGVRVLKIDAEKVEFARDGTTWTQPLGAPPQPFWGRAE